MPVFNVYLPAGRFNDDQKNALSFALPRSLFNSLGIPAEDQFVILTEQPTGTLIIDPTYMGMERTDSALIITVLFTAERPLENKKKFTRELCAQVSSALDISPDDIFIALIPVPRENFSFGRGELQLSKQDE